MCFLFVVTSHCMENWRCFVCVYVSSYCAWLLAQSEYMRTLHVEHSVFLRYVWGRSTPTGYFAMVLLQWYGGKVGKHCLCNLLHTVYVRKTYFLISIFFSPKIFPKTTQKNTNHSKKGSHTQFSFAIIFCRRAAEVKKIRVNL